MTTVLVTGASAGFGAAIARRFATDGARVVIAARRLDRLEELAEELGALVHPVELDVQDQSAVAAAVQSLPAAFAEIDILVNNAGLALGLEPAQQADPTNWQQMIDTNCAGLAWRTRAVTCTALPRPSFGSSASTYAPICTAPGCGSPASSRAWSAGRSSRRCGSPATPIGS